MTNCGLHNDYNELVVFSQHMHKLLDVDFEYLFNDSFNISGRPFFLLIRAGFGLVFLAAIDSWNFVLDKESSFFIPRITLNTLWFVPREFFHREFQLSTGLLVVC